MKKIFKNLLNWADKTQARGYREIVGAGSAAMTDWPFYSMQEDSDIWQNILSLRSRMRDLWKGNPYFSKYRELLAANVFGEEGHYLRMKIKETEDRVLANPAERWELTAYERRRDAVRLWSQRRSGRRLPKFRAFTEDAQTRKAMVKVGDPDIYANLLIERRWKEWQRAEFCDLRGLRDYGTLRQLRLWSAARDGDFFIRMVRDPRVNKFGFALQCVNAEWCDYFLNAKLDNGNVIRLGIEYEFRPWGLGKPVAYHFIKRKENDWQFTVPGMSDAPSAWHDRIPAEDIIHYARYTDNDGTRPAPWGASTIIKARALDQFEIAEVFAARAAACKTGWAYSDMVPEGGAAVGVPDPVAAVRNLNVTPGGLYGLPYGIKIQDVDPTHPNGNFEDFRKGMLRAWCAGLPGADYNTIANDLENINFSAGRLGRLDTNEMSKLIQRFDICKAEIPIFEAWLEMSLVTGAIPLPLAKFEKFNRPHFQGRRWAQVDEVKAETASGMRIANNKSSWGAECDMDGVDFEEMIFEKAENMMTMEALGVDPTLTVQKTPAPTEPDADETETEDEAKPKAPPASNGNGNGKHFTAPTPRF